MKLFSFFKVPVFLVLHAELHVELLTFAPLLPFSLQHCVLSIKTQAEKASLLMKLTLI